MKRFISILLCLITVFSLCSCSISSGNDFILGVYGTVSSLDPVKAESDAEKIISANCFEGLLRFDENGNVNLAGATAYTMQKDGLAYTFKLNPSAQWSITKENKEIIKEKDIDLNKSITAYDYAFGFEHFKKSFKDELDAVDSFTVTDDYTLEIKLSYHDPDFLYKLSALPLFPLNESFYNAISKDYGKSIGTILFNGPYCVTSSSDAETVIERNTVYNGNIQIQNNKILLYTTGTKELMSSRFKDGTYNVFIGNDYEPLAGKDAKFISTNKVWGLAFNCKSQTGADLSLRTALLCALDLTSVVLPDFASSASKGLIPDNFIAGDKKYGEFAHEGYSYEQNTKKAVNQFNTALKSLGKNALDLTFAVPEEMEETAQKLVAQWQKLFGGKINVSLSTFKATDAEKIAEAGSYDVAILHLMPATNTANGIIEAISNAPCYYEKKEKSGEQATYSTITSENIDLYNKKEIEIVKSGVFVPLFYTGHKLYLKENTSGIYLANGGELIYFHKGVQG